MDTVREQSKKLITMSEMMKRLNRSKQSINVWVKAGQFPSPVRTQTGYTVGWTEQQYDTWIAENTR